MPKANVFYTEAAKAKINDKRNVVISICSKGGFTVAQQLEVDEGDKSTNVFLKGAFHVGSLDELYNLRDAINAAIEKIEKYEPKEEDAWDDEVTD